MKLGDERGWLFGSEGIFLSGLAGQEASDVHPMGNLAEKPAYKRA